MEYRVRVCLDTGRVFVCGGPSGEYVCEALGHGGLTAAETAERIALCMNRARAGHPGVDPGEAPAGFAAAECRSGCAGCAFWRGTCGLLPEFTAKGRGFGSLPCHSANRKDGRSVIFVTEGVEAKPPRRRSGRRAEVGFPRDVRKEGEG